MQTIIPRKEAVKKNSNIILQEKNVIKGICQKELLFQHYAKIATGI